MCYDIAWYRPEKVINITINMMLQKRAIILYKYLLSLQHHRINDTIVSQINILDAKNFL